MSVDNHELLFHISNKRTIYIVCDLCTRPSCQYSDDERILLHLTICHEMETKCFDVLALHFEL